MLAEKPIMAEETDLLYPTLLDELICNIASLASVYHKPPAAFLEGKVRLKRMLPALAPGEDSGSEPGSLIGDLLDMDICGSCAGLKHTPRGHLQDGRG